MTTLLNKLSFLTVVVSFISGSVFADESISQQSSFQHSSISDDRQLSDLEYYLMQEERFKDEQQMLEEGGVDEEKLNKMNTEGEEETKTAGCFSCHDKQYQYKEIFQVPIWFAEDDSLIQLQDGSLWQIDPRDIPLIYHWLLNNHRLYITPNRWYFSDYRFEIVNADLEQIIRVNRVGNPIFNVHQIKIIDYDHDVITISEGYDIFGRPTYSRWKISYKDHHTINKWLIEDRIIVGANVGISKAFDLYILYNAETDSYACASFVEKFRF